jgi:hypothetical protein
MKKSISAALFIACFATSALAQAAWYSDRVTVNDADSCPAGTYASVPSYERQDGRFVRNGWVCESLYHGGY